MSEPAYLDLADPAHWGVVLQPAAHRLVGEHHLYNFLSWLLDWAVRALGEPIS